MNIKVIDLFGFADQDKVTYGLGYTLTLKRDVNNDPFIGENGADAAKYVIKDIGWNIPHFTPSLESQQSLVDQLLKRDPTELYYMDWIVFRKDVHTAKNSTCDLRNSEESTQFFLIVGFQVRDKIDSQTHDNAMLDRLPISNAVCKIASEKICCWK